VAEAKDGTSLVLAVADGDTADRKAGHFNAVAVQPLRLRMHTTGQLAA
jgi:hypothetical protein